MNVGSLIYSKAAGYIPASLCKRKSFNKTSYNARSRGGGNCTRVLNDTSHLRKMTCEKCSLGLSELCRHDEALHERVGSSASSHFGCHGQDHGDRSGRTVTLPANLSLRIEHIADTGKCGA